MSNETTLDDVLALLAKATPGTFAGNMRRDESIYVSVGDPLKGPHAQGDVYLPCPDVDAMVSALNYLRAHGDELRAALEDARRLDWLDANGFTAYRSIDPIDGLSGHCTVVHETQRPRRGNVVDTIRQAIDAAQEVGK